MQVVYCSRQVTVILLTDSPSRPKTQKTHEFKPLLGGQAAPSMPKKGHVKVVGQVNHLERHIVRSSIQVTAALLTDSHSRSRTQKTLWIQAISRGEGSPQHARERASEGHRASEPLRQTGILLWQAGSRCTADQ